MLTSIVQETGAWSKSHAYEGPVFFFCCKTVLNPIEKFKVTILHLIWIGITEHRISQTLRMKWSRNTVFTESKLTPRKGQ